MVGEITLWIPGFNSSTKKIYQKIEILLFAKSLMVIKYQISSLSESFLGNKVSVACILPERFDLLVTFGIWIMYIKVY